MHEYLQWTKAIEYLIFSSNRKSLVVSQALNIQVKLACLLPSSPHPTPPAEEVWSSPWNVWEFLGSGTALCSHHLGPAIFTVCHEPDPDSITCQLRDFRQVVFGFWDSVPFSINERLNLDKNGTCLQGWAKYREWVTQIFHVRQRRVMTITANGTGCPWQRKKLIRHQLIVVWEWGLSMATFPVFSKRCRKSGFSCEIFQFLTVGTNIFRNTKWAKLNTSVCRIQPLGLEGIASGPEDV